MPLKVYLDPLSQPCRAVMLLLETNKVQYEKVLLQLRSGESVRSAIVRVASIISAFSSSEIYVAIGTLCAGIYGLILAISPSARRL